MRERADLGAAVATAWLAFGRAAALPSRVSPAVPVLFFGDLAAYRSSPLRVLTVGLNPSRREFPAEAPFRRFPRAAGDTGNEPDRYLEALSAYSRTDPYRLWFSAWEPLLNGAASSYYAGQPSTALHTDICSPVATDPTWSHLDGAARATLQADGGPLWHRLLAVLRPQVVALSVARRHLSRIEFDALTDWEVIRWFESTSSGAPRKRPYEVSTRWYEVGGERALFVFGRAANTPFGLLQAAQRHEAGTIVLEAYRRHGR